MLRSYNAPISINAHGVAGQGLYAAGFSAQNTYSGRLGEVGFYKALCMSDLIDHASSFWSVAMPSEDGRGVPDTRYNTDIDCVLVQGPTVHLIDLKYYSSGDVTWHAPHGDELMCRDNETGAQVGNPRRMSRNMAMATSRFSKLFPDLDIHSHVVLLPTDQGIGLVEQGTCWPGGVPLRPLPEMLDLVRKGPAQRADERVSRVLSGLLKEIT